MLNLREMIHRMSKWLRGRSSPPDPHKVFSADDPAFVDEFMASIKDIEYPRVRVNEGFGYAEIEDFFSDAWFYVVWPPPQTETGWILGQHVEDPTQAIEVEEKTGAIMYYGWTPILDDILVYRTPLATNLEEFISKLKSAGWNGAWDD